MAYAPPAGRMDMSSIRESTALTAAATKESQTPTGGCNYRIQRRRKPVPKEDRKGGLLTLLSEGGLFHLLSLVP